MLLMGHLRNVMPQRFTMEHMFRMVKDLKVVLGTEKGGGSKKTKKTGKNVEKNIENNDNETSVLFKKDQYFGTYHIGRT
jgi:hypothetical protein